MTWPSPVSSKLHTNIESHGLTAPQLRREGLYSSGLKTTSPTSCRRSSLSGWASFPEGPPPRVSTSTRFSTLSGNLEETTRRSARSAPSNTRSSTSPGQTRRAGRDRMPNHGTVTLHSNLSQLISPRFDSCSSRRRVAVCPTHFRSAITPRWRA